MGEQYRLAMEHGRKLQATPGDSVATTPTPVLLGVRVVVIGAVALNSTAVLPCALG